MASQGDLILLVSGLGTCYLSDPCLNSLDPLLGSSLLRQKVGVSNHHLHAPLSAVRLSSG